MKIRFIAKTDNARVVFARFGNVEGASFDVERGVLEGSPVLSAGASRKLDKATAHFNSFKNAQVQNMIKEGVKPREYELEVVL